MQFVDTHAHVHFDDYALDAAQTIAAARDKGVTRIIEVGCTLHDSKTGVAMAQAHDGIWASIGIHPHEAKDFLAIGGGKEEFAGLLEGAQAKEIVAIGETGLDYFYDNSPRDQQIELLEFQLDLAQKHDIPVIFHVREAFDEFWPIFDNFPGLQGVLHSYTDTSANLDKAMARGLHIGLNGIMTFTKVPEQLEMAKAVPIDRLLLETDAPFLTPKPFRGTICMPEHVIVTAQFLADLRGETLQDLAAQTTQNAIRLFNI